MTIAHIPTPWEAVFAQIDAEGNTTATARAPAILPAITPLAALELYERLHAARNELRKKAGLPEQATPDTALLCLAFLRREAEEPAESLRGLLDHFDAAARQIQINRVEQLVEE